MSDSIRLDGLEVEEVSGVAAPANLTNGWIVMKNATNTTTVNTSTSVSYSVTTKAKKALTREQRLAEIRRALADRARAKGRTVSDEVLDSFADQALVIEEGGDEFQVALWDEDLAATDTDYRNLMARRRREREQHPEEFVMSPKPKTEAEAVEAYRASKQVEQTQRVRDNLRREGAHQRGFTDEEAMTKALGVVVGATNTIAEAAKALGGGEVAVSKVAREALDKRQRAPVTKERLSIGETIRKAREALRLPKESAAERAGVTIRGWELYECGQSLPENPAKVARAVALDELPFVHAVEKARG